MRSVTRAATLSALVLLAPACETHEPLGPTPVDQGVIVYMHSGFRGTSQQIARDVPDLGDVQGPCGGGDDEASRTWNDCISSIRVLPGWRATLYGDDDYRGATLDVTEDTPDLGALKGSCSGSLNDCISSIRVSRR